MPNADFDHLSAQWPWYRPPTLGPLSPHSLGPGARPRGPSPGQPVFVYPWSGPSPRTGTFRRRWDISAQVGHFGAPAAFPPACHIPAQQDGGCALPGAVLPRVKSDRARLPGPARRGHS